MATTRIMPLHVGKGRTESRAISDIIDYVANPQKTDNGRLITGYACDSRTADAEFLLAKRQYIAATGRVRGTDDVIAYHVRQSFRPGEITPEEANRLGVEFAKRFTKGNHAFVVCTHIDKSHVHNHIIWSAVSLEYDRKFRNFWGSTKAVRRLSDTICIENGLSIVENPKPHGKNYNKYMGMRQRILRDRSRIILQSLKASRGSNIKYKPYVFTEQGVYMLMTVLRGELAIQQSRALVKTFKRMKDYILENCDLIGQRELLQLSMETANNRIEISKINSDMISLEKQISDVAEGLKDVVTKSELADMMNSFISDDDEKWLMRSKYPPPFRWWIQQECPDKKIQRRQENERITEPDVLRGSWPR